LSLDLTTIITEASDRLWDKFNRRYTVPAIIRWLNYTLDDCTWKTGFEKKKATAVGTDYIVALGTTPRYFELPSDFVGLDKNSGILVNGLRRLPTSAGEVDLFQQKGIAKNDLDSDDTLYIDDYFSESYTGLILHYAIDFVYKDEIDATPARSGKLIWFTPDLADTDAVTYQYYVLADQYATGSSNQANLARHTSEVLILGIIYRAMQKAFFGGAVNRDRFDVAKALYDEKMGEVAAYYADANKETDKMPKIKTARQVYGMYNSARGGG